MKIKSGTGAIERLLHSFGMSMIVPAQLYNRISYYVNNTTLQSRDGNGKDWYTIKLKS